MPAWRMPERISMSDNEKKPVSPRAMAGAAISLRQMARVR